MGSPPPMDLDLPIHHPSPPSPLTCETIHDAMDMDIDSPSLNASIPPTSSNTFTPPFDPSSPPGEVTSTPDHHLVMPGTPTHHTRSTPPSLLRSTPTNIPHTPLVPSKLRESITPTVEKKPSLHLGLGISVFDDDEEDEEGEDDKPRVPPPTPRTYGRKRSRSVMAPFTPVGVDSMEDDQDEDDGRPSRSRTRETQRDETPSPPTLASSSRLQSIALPRTSPSPSPSPTRGSRPGMRARRKSFSSLRPLPVSPTPTSKSRPMGRSALIDDKLEISDNPRQVMVKDEEKLVKGETIMRAPLMYTALHTSALSTHCAGCLLDPETKYRKQGGASLNAVRQGYLRCRRCDSIQYCSLRCCAKHNMAHWPECRALSRCKDLPSVEVRLLAKMIFARASGKAPPLPVYDLPKLNDGPMLELAGIVKEVTIFLCKVHDAEGTFRWSEYRFKGQGDAARFIRQARVMTMPLRDEFERPVGLCIANLPSRIQHSCRPSAFVAFPEGLNVAKPLRVISIDPTWPSVGGEEVTISYADLATPCHQREAQLDRRGFQHDCAWCSRDQKTADKRWSMLHTDCNGDEEGLLSWTDTPGSAFFNATCSSCGEICTGVSRLAYDAIIHDLVNWYDRENDDLFIMPFVQTDNRIECGVLVEIISNLEEHHPETIYPLPHLRHKLALLLLYNTDRDTVDCEVAINELERSYWSYISCFDHEPRPLTLSILLSSLHAHLAMIRQGEKELRIARTTWGESDRRRGTSSLASLNRPSLAPSPKIIPSKADFTVDSDHANLDDNDTTQLVIQAYPEKSIKEWKATIKRYITKASEMTLRATNEYLELGGGIDGGSSMSGGMSREIERCWKELDEMAFRWKVVIHRPDQLD